MLKLNVLDPLAGLRPSKFSAGTQQNQTLEWALHLSFWKYMHLWSKNEYIYNIIILLYYRYILFL